MSEFLRLKKSNCKNCYKCIRHCPVKSIRFSANQAHIVSDECILCGQCFVICPQNAKQIESQLERVNVLLMSGSPVYVSLAPSFVANYESAGIEGMRQALMQLGFAGVEETAIGAKMVKTEYENIIEKEAPDVLISSCCHSVNLLIQKYFPTALQYLAKVKSPMQAHCADIKARFPGAKTVFIGPCVAKMDEANRYSEVDAVLTFEQLTSWLNEKGIEIPKEIDSNENSKTRLFPTCGGILKTMTEKEGYTYIAIDGTENCINALRDIENGNIKDCFIEMSACVGSCANGPVMEKYHHSPIKSHILIEKYAGENDFICNQPESESLKKAMDFLAPQKLRPGEREIVETLKKMGKTKPEDELNCGSCGYNTCREKAVAIIRGKAEISMCLPYLKEKAENFSDNIINNTPNGIIVLNDSLEIQQINASALKIFNLRRADDVMGESVVRVLDPKVFLDVLSSKKKVQNERVYLAEYNRYIEQSVVYDKAYNIIICIMKDVSDEESARKRKEDLSRSTIEVADKVVDRQMRIVQEIASLLGETAAETKIALTKLKESINDE
ncbi:MAG: [Fe-Fe] hydrogenase large subunit C-terminal domain-containing protein [Acutalibacteraceae bacterium]